MGYSQANNYNIGDVVDDFTVTDTNGVEHNLYSITAQGKYVFLEFFFPNSGQAQNQTPFFNEFYDRYGCNMGDTFSLLFGILANNAEIDQFQNEFGGPFNKAPAVSDDGGSGEVTNNFGFSSLPEYVLIGPDNVLINDDIFPITSVSIFEDAIPSGVTINPMSCTLGLTNIQAPTFELYPTISNGENIVLEMNTAERSEVFIYDMTGRQVFSKEFSERTLELNLNVSRGIYLVKLNTDSGTTTKKIIIQ